MRILFASRQLDATHAPICDESIENSGKWVERLTAGSALLWHFGFQVHPRGRIVCPRLVCVYLENFHISIFRAPVEFNKRSDSLHFAQSILSAVRAPRPVHDGCAFVQRVHTTPVVLQAAVTIRVR